jgi:glycosyltransferase involved in cell wall biosynthesis
MSGLSGSQEIIAKQYLLVTMSVPIFEDAGGRQYLDSMWAKDLAAHLTYLPHLHLVCPRRTDVLPANCVPLDSLEWIRSIKVTTLPAPRSFLHALWCLPVTCSVLYRAIGSCDIVQTAVAGWPIPGAWLVIPMARWLGKSTVINVESAFWRPPAGAPVGWAWRLKSAIYERLNKWAIQRVDVAFFTSQAYKDSLMSGNGSRGHVVQASWIDAKHLALDRLTDAEFAVNPSSVGKPRLKLLFAGRLLQEKGLGTLVEAVHLAVKRGVELELDILGEGSFEAPCRQQVTALGLSNVRFIGLVPYGPEFFALLRRYDVLVVPSLSDEQPRIVYDAYSQCVPVIATRTPGLMACVNHAQEGLLVDIGSAAALADAMAWAQQHPNDMRLMGRRGLEVARGMTHEGMHHRRSVVLSRAFIDPLTTA